jgi:hypothetical protein
VHLLHVPDELSAEQLVRHGGLVRRFSTERQAALGDWMGDGGRR